jgi:hypothetical protein
MQAKDEIHRAPSRVWVARMHHSISSALASLVRTRPKTRHAVDPNDELIFESCDVLKELVDVSSSDTREAIGKLAIATLAELATHQSEFDGEAIEVAMQLFADLYKGSAASRKANRELFFRGDGRESCLAMLRNLDEVFKAAETFGTQFHFLDVSCTSIAHQARLGKRQSALAQAVRAPPTAPSGLGFARRECGAISQASVRKVPGSTGLVEA